ncbi:MAG: AAA family ATPase [Ruminococcaceae bacterium]|nr:AAA family ATPase [Oscillospiraceae bacterium]
MKIKEIKAALNGLVDDIAQCDADYCEEEIRTWLMAATLKVWAGNKLFSEDYVQLLPVFKGQNYTVAQVIAALDCAGDDSREMNIPMFFRNIAAKDKENNTSKSRTIADSIGRFLVLAALINGDFTIDEANALMGISDLLLDYCDEQRVAAGKEREYHPEMVTPLNQTGYCRPLSDDKRREEVNPLSGSDVSASPAENSAPTITLNISLAPEQSDELDVFAPASGVTVSKPAAGEDDAEETLESVLAELHGLVGLDKVKNDVQSLLNFIRICQMRTQRGMKVPAVSYHLVFTGNPGTGKTTVARMVARLYYLMGILPQGQLVETDRSGLVAGYLGQTAIKTQKVIQEALGGVLFIDEAYALANDKEDSYGKEAIETILKAMEDHRDELVVIVAGYDELMHKFIESNPGLRSRFNKYFHFPDYTGSDLLAIFDRFCETNGYTLAEDPAAPLRERLDEMYANREEHFGNARAVRNLFERAINQQANRLVMDSNITDSKLAELTLEDILLALEMM